MKFSALVVEKDDTGATSSSVKTVALDDLPEGDVSVKVDYSTINYKDGLCLGSGGGLVRAYPHVPGIDFAGSVVESSSPDFVEGDEVVLTGWRVGETRWGGYAQYARVKADWLVKLPASIDTRTAMAVGTAGLTSMLAIQALEHHGMQKENGPVLVTGASGGVGSMAVLLLSEMGFEVTAVTGRHESEQYLKELGAKNILPRSELAETTRRPLEKETWNGCIDAVGGSMLARVLGQMKYGSSIAAVGLAGGVDLPATVIPFLLRGVNLLGIDSVMQPIDARITAWTRIGQYLNRDKLQQVTSMKTLGDLPQLGQDILRGQVRGRVIIDVNSP